MMVGAVADMMVEGHIVMAKLLWELLKKGFQITGQIFDVLIGMLENY